MKTIKILHPFTGEAAGVVESKIPKYHSQPHVKALQYLIKKHKFKCSIEYFSSKFFGYNFTINDLSWQFFPVSKKINGDHKKWKKQFSKKCINYYRTDTPDLTFINMSGHSSPFSFQLSKVILSNGKKYVAMLGGQHYTVNERNFEYYQKADHIIVHTKLQKQHLQSNAMFKGKDILVYPLGVDCDIFKPIEISESNLESPKLLYVGRIVEWKRIHLAIEAIDLLVKSGFENASLDIIGPVSSKEYMNKLKDLIIIKNLSNHVNFIGYVDYKDLPTYFSKAHVFTLPSDKETFGMVMIESMACGTPVIGINCPGGPKDVITNNHDGILTLPEEYAEAVLSCFKDNKLAKMSNNARQTILDNYSLDITNKVIEKSVELALKD